MKTAKKKLTKIIGKCVVSAYYKCENGVDQEVVLKFDDGTEFVCGGEASEFSYEIKKVAK